MMIRPRSLIAALTLALLVPVAASAQTVAASTAQAAPAPRPPITPIRPDDRTLGSAEAPVTLTVYLSTTCSHCADWHNNSFPAIRAKYVDTGLVRVVYRDLPTAPREVAFSGAVMARCVPAEHYDDALHSLYRGQAALRSETQEELDLKVVDWLAAAGAAGGLTTEQMRTCLTDGANRNVLDARIAASRSDGVRGTPTFFINGAEAEIWDVESLDAVVQPLLTAN